MTTEIKQILIKALEVPMDVQTTKGICHHIVKGTRHLTQELKDGVQHLFELEAERILGYPLVSAYWLFPLGEEGDYTEPEWDGIYVDLTYEGKSARDLYDDALANADHPLWETRRKLIQDILRNLEMREKLIRILRTPLSKRGSQGVCIHIDQHPDYHIKAYDLFMGMVPDILGHHIDTAFWMFPLEEDGSYAKPVWDEELEEYSHKGRTAEAWYTENKPGFKAHPLHAARTKLINDILKELEK